MVELKNSTPMGGLIAQYLLDLKSIPKQDMNKNLYGGNYPWEIRYDSEGADKDLNEYPHILDVSCTFQPVHNFAPSNSPTTPFILPEIGVNGNRRYARQSDNENQDQFGTNGVASSPENATNIVNSPPPPAPPPALNPVPTPSNDITPIEERGLLT